MTILLEKWRHQGLLAALLILTIGAAWPGLGLTHYIVAMYGALLIPQGIVWGIMVGQLGETVILPRDGDDDKQRRRPPYIEAVNDSQTKAAILAVVAAAFALLAAGWCINGMVRCTTQGFDNVTNLGDYVFANPQCNASLTTLMRRQPYLVTELQNYDMCQDSLGVSIAFAVFALALAIVDVLIAAWHESAALDHVS